MQIIHNATIYCCDPQQTVISNGYLIVENGCITALGQGLPEHGLEIKAHGAEVLDAEILDAGGALLTPGFVNAHTHIPMILFRDLGENMPGKDLLFKLFFPIEKQFITDEFVYDASRLSCLELLSGGITCFADMYYFEEQVARAAKEIGIRAVLGQTIAHFPTPDSPQPYGGLDPARTFVQQFAGDGVVSPAYAPHAPYSVSTEILQEINRCAEQDGAPVLSHLGEMKDEPELVWQNLKQNPERAPSVRYLTEKQLLNSRWLAAHCIQLDGEEQQMLRDCGVRVSHNPLSNLKGEQGTAPMAELQQLGVPIGLGTDSALGGNSQHLFEAMSYAYYLQRNRLQDHRALSASEVLHWATLGGATALGLGDKTGSLELGKWADMILWRPDSFALYDALNIPAALVLAAGPQDIDRVWVAGKPQLVAGRLVDAQHTAIIECARAWRAKIRQFCHKNQIL